MAKIDKVLVLFSSQTGTAESIAELYVKDDLPQVCTSPSFYSTNAYMKLDPELTQLTTYDYVLFIIATTGAGDFPDSALSIMRVLRRLDKKVDPDDPSTLPFSSLRMMNLGLGDSNYDRFNGGIQQAEKLLTRLGAQKVLQTVLADDGIGLEMGVEKWRKDTIEYFKGIITQTAITGPEQSITTQSELSSEPTTLPPPPQRHNILVLYSSQTGTAESIAELFVKDDLPALQTKGLINAPQVYSTQVYVKEDPELQNLANNFSHVLFIVSTTGAGDFPDSALSIMRVLRRLDKKIDPNDPTTLVFSKIKMANLGLGDTNYDRFNGGIEQVEKVLTRLGAVKGMPTVLADDGTGLEVGVEKWRKETIAYLERALSAVTIDESNSNTHQSNGVPAKNAVESASQNQTTSTSTRSNGKELLTQPIFATPTFSTNPPTSARKPDFLLKQHQAKLSTYLVNPASYSTCLDALKTNQPSPIVIDPISNVIDMNQNKCIEQNVSKLFTNTTSTSGLHVYAADSLLLQQYISGHNMHQFINTTTEASQTQQIQSTLLSQLSQIEYGYSNIHTIPLFAHISDLSLPIETEPTHPEVKTVLDITLSLPPSTAQALGKIPIAAEGNPTVSIDTLARNGDAGDSLVQVRSLYRPGDSISLLCPNRTQSTQELLFHTKLEEFSNHGVLLNTIPTPSTEQSTSTTPQLIAPITSPITHGHIPQPCSKLFNTFILPQFTSTQPPTVSNVSQPPQDLIESIINIGNVLINYKSAQITSILPTLSSIFNYSLDLTSPMKKSLIRSFAEMCSTIQSTGDEAKFDQQYQSCVVELLFELMSKDGRSKLKEYFDDKSISISEFLGLFTVPSELRNATAGPKQSAICPQLDILIELCGSLKPRSYSISSSPYHHLIDNNSSALYNLAAQSDIAKLHSNQPQNLIAGSSFRFAATLTVDDVPQIDAIPPASYYEAKKWSEVQSEFNIISDLCDVGKDKGPDAHPAIADTTLQTATPNRTYKGLCTHWLLQLYHDISELQSTTITSEQDFIAFLTSPSQHHNNPTRFYGAVVVIDTKKDNFDWNCLGSNTNHKTSNPLHFLSISLPFFFHTSPTFHPPTLLTQSTASNQLPHNTTQPNNNMLLLGPGTGASPFLSFVEHKFYTNLAQNIITSPTTPTLPQNFNKPRTTFKTSVDLSNLTSLVNYYDSSIVVQGGDSTMSAQPDNNSHPSTEDCKRYGEITLYTGNRYRNKDYLYAQHWYELLSTNSLTSLHSVFSRELPRTITTGALGLQSPTPDGEEKKQRYVQDLLLSHSSDVAKHVLTGGFVYVCGDGVSMSKQVQKVVETCISQHCVELGHLYSIQHDVILPQRTDESQQSNSNPTTYTTRFNNESVSAQLVEYMKKDPALFKTRAESDTWARGIITIMVKSGRYNTDVW